MSLFFVRRAWVVFMAVALLWIANPAAAADGGDMANYASSSPPSAAAMGADALIVRPLSLAGTVLGAGLFVVSLPAALLGRNVGQAWHRLVIEPARYTFVRPLGNFQASRPGH